MRVELQQAYVLHARPFKDTSLILDCLTEDYGRMAILAKGARSAKSRQRQLCQPFTPISISWQGKGDLKTLIGIEARSLPFSLQGNYLYSGLYLNELLTRLLPERDAHPETYQRYHLALEQLATERILEPILREFELGLLFDMGYAVNFESDEQGAPLSDTGYYLWRDQQGWVFTAENAGNGFSGASLLAIGGNDWSSSVTCQQAKALTRMLLKPLLGNRPLNSRKLFS
ncbi:MAG: DNA repair protein RecO [Cellvibrionaceae bacterium]